MSDSESGELKPAEAEKVEPVEPEPVSNVVSLEPRLRGTRSLLVVTRARASCYPHAFELDEQTRVVTCRLCTRVFDAFDAMIYMAQHWPDYQGHRQALQEEIADMRKEAEELKRQIKNHRATVRRAGDDPGPSKYRRF